MSSHFINWSRGLLGRRSEREAPGGTATGGGRQSGDPVEVYVAANDLEAQVVKGFLESQEIPVMLRHEALGTALGLTQVPLAEVSVLVPAAVAARAVELLEVQAAEAQEAALGFEDGEEGEEDDS